MFKRRGNGQCANTMCDIVLKHRPEEVIGFVCEQIVNFERHFGSVYKDLVRDMIKEAVDRYGPGTICERDERMLPIYRILVRYCKTMSAAEVYGNLNEKKLFLFNAQFYVDWASVHMEQANYPFAAQIVGDAIKLFGAGHPVLGQLKKTVDRVLAERQAAAAAAAVVAENAYSYPPPPFVPPSIAASASASAPSARSLDFGALITRAPSGLPKQQQQAPPPVAAAGTPVVPQSGLLERVPRPPIDTSIVWYNKAVGATAAATAQFHASAAVRRVLGPIQAPARVAAAEAAAVAAAEAAAASVAEAAVAAIIGPLADDQDVFPPPPVAASSSSSLAAVPAQPVQQPQPMEESVDNNDDDENQEKVAPKKQQQQSVKSQQPKPTSVVLPEISGPSPLDQDMISPSLAQMKPGRENQFYMPPVYTFAEGARGPDKAKQ